MYFTAQTSHCLQRKVLLCHYILLYTAQALNILINVMRQFAGKHLNTDIGFNISRTYFWS